MRKHLTNRTFGVEIEFLIQMNERSFEEVIRHLVEELRKHGISTIWEGYTHQVTEEWKIVTDASVYWKSNDCEDTNDEDPSVDESNERILLDSLKRNDYIGLELVSPILTRDRLWEIVIACDVLKLCKCIVNSTCGLHVHHDITELKRSAFLGLLESYKHYEFKIDLLMHKSRRENGNKYCLTMGHIDTHEILEEVEKLEGNSHWRVSNREFVNLILDNINWNYPNMTYEDTRYVKLNFSSYRIYGTVEFRHHHGTLDSQEIINWIYLSQRMVETAKKGKDVFNPDNGGKTNIYTFDSMMSFFEIENNIPGYSPLDYYTNKVQA